MNVRQLPPPPSTSRDAQIAAALAAEVRLALVHMQPVAFGSPNLALTVPEQRICDMAWRLGYLARGMEAISERLTILLPPNPPRPEAAAAGAQEKTEPSHA